MSGNPQEPGRAFWEAYIAANPWPGGEGPKSFDDLSPNAQAAIKAGVQAAEMACVTWQSQNDYLRELIAEILDTLGPYASMAPIAAWRERAGLGPEVTA